MLAMMGGMMIAPTTAAAAPAATVTFNGAFSTVSPSSVVESPLLTATVPGGGSGIVTLRDFDATGALTFQTSFNGGSYATKTDGSTLTFTTGQTLRMRITGVGVGDSFSLILVDNDTGQIIESITLRYSSGPGGGGGGGIAP